MSIRLINGVGLFVVHAIDVRIKEDTLTAKAAAVDLILIYLLHLMMKIIAIAKMEFYVGALSRVDWF
jgi:hypothetical protein